MNGIHLLSCQMWSHLCPVCVTFVPLAPEGGSVICFKLPALQRAVTEKIDTWGVGLPTREEANLLNLSVLWRCVCPTCQLAGLSNLMWLTGRRQHCDTYKKKMQLVAHWKHQLLAAGSVRGRNVWKEKNDSRNLYLPFDDLKWWIRKESSEKWGLEEEKFFICQRH